ncbi:MAG: HAD family hydrolase, partial [Ancrocorticia populi]
MATSNPQIQALLCDMDGTLSDTEVFWQQAERRIIAEYGNPTAGGGPSHQTIGVSMEASAALLRDQYGVALEIDQLIQLAVDFALESMSGGVKWMPGVLALLDEAEAAGIPRVLVTSSPSSVARAIVSELPGQSFDAIISGDDVSSHKPEPEPYLRAAEALGAEVQRCV